MSWETELRRLPELKPEARVIGIHGDDRAEPPRGARVCWLEVVEIGRRRDLPVTLTVHPVERVPIAVGDIAPRTPITPDLVSWQELPTQGFGATHIATESDLQGAWARVRIPAGTVITGRRIAPLPAVVIGQSLKLVIRLGRIEAVADGKALEDGRIGEKIRVLNLVSGSRLRGRLEAGGMVIVE